MKASVPVPSPATAEAPPQAAPDPMRITWGPVIAVLGTFALYFGSMVLAAIVVGVGVTLTGMANKDVATWLDESVVGQFMYIALAEVAVLTGLMGVLRHYKSSFRALGLVRPQPRDIAYALAGLTVYLPLLIGTTAAVKVLLPVIDIEQRQQIGFESANGPVQLALVFVALVVLAPFTEEVLVRGFLYSGLKSRLPKVVAVLGTSVLFAIAHLQFGSGAPLLWTAAIDTFLLSLILIYLREKTGSLWAGIGLHALKNCLAFLALFVFRL